MKKNQNIRKKTLAYKVQDSNQDYNKNIVITFSKHYSICREHKVEFFDFLGI